MTRGTHLAALTSSLAALAEEQDVVSTLVEAVGASAETLDGDVGVVVSEDLTAPSAGRLDLLAASPHAAASLELYQLQVDSGPCLDALAEDADVSVVGDAAMRERWPRRRSPAPGTTPCTRSCCAGAGSRSARSTCSSPRAHPLTADERQTARGFADIAAVAIVHAGDRPDLASVAEAVRATAEHRALLEQAKGALRYLLDADEGQAFTQLAQRARATRAPVTEVAREVMETITAGRRPDWLPDA
jgi:hypothetical protein